MISVTENARELLKETLNAHSSDPELGLRLSLKPPGQLGIILDKEAEGDQVVEHEGAKVLIVAPELASFFDGTKLDTEDTANGPQLTIFDER